MPRLRMRLLLCVVCLVLSQARLLCAEERILADRLERILKLSAGVGVTVQALEQEAPAFSYNGKAALKPASVLKIATSVAALNRLGAGFRFETHVFRGNEGPEKVLYVKGGGAPDLAIEQLWLIVRQLRIRGIGSIDRIVLDESQFVAPKRRNGQRAYETGGGALSFNYNSLTVHICPQEPGHSALVTIDPWEAELPLSGAILTASKDSFVVDEGKEGLVVRGSVARGSSCRTVYRSVEDPGALFGQVLRALLKQLGVKGKMAIDRGIVPSAAHKLFSEGSKPLALIVRDLNHYSNNFIAEQLLHAISKEGALPWDRMRGLQRVQQLLTVQGLPAHIVDGSGLDHENRATTEAFVQILRAALSDPHIAPELLASLSKNGESGTLKKRSLGLPDGTVRAKTGTLRDTVSLAGVVTAKSGREYVFAIFHNGRATQSAYTNESQLAQTIYNFG
ncbi:MAG: D-alanyl-D-alanine carboxypeptidase/D-alanyl-D-alanine-endopeptidase [Bdellovibrionota bacterium]|nr:MAG: D-alanyl-D-alanine carboxypeptidase/D-alanyl-D-alanine-endopeptidase [Bdellovibrionota bacterium]